jgi:hypothetical protein
MARNLGHARLAVALAIVGLGVVGLDAAGRAAPPASSGTAIGTPLPPEWELCVLKGIGANSTHDDVVNLDAWQVAEGGSTNNTAAYNPFNTRQVTDAKGAPLPVSSTDGFPGFATWDAGCAATVATLLQSNMAPIVKALKAGNVAPPGMFLREVDKSAWCAPSADGIPCYAGQILAAEILQVLLNGSTGPLTDALLSYSNTGVDLSSYQENAAVAGADQVVLGAKTQQLAVTDAEVSVAQAQLSVATGALRNLAVDDFTGTSQLRSNANLQLFGPPDEQGVMAQYLGNMAASMLVDHYDQANATVKGLLAVRATVAASVAQATAVVDAAQAVENQSLARLDADVKSIEAARSCAPPPTTTAAASSVDGQASAGVLWTALQDCLAPPAGSPAPTTVPARS